MIKYNFTEDYNIQIKVGSVRLTSNEINFKKLKEAFNVQTIDFEIDDRREVTLEINDVNDLPVVKDYLNISKSKLDLRSTEKLTDLLIKEEILTESNCCFYLLLPKSRYAIRLSDGLDKYESVMEYLYKNV